MYFLDERFLALVPIFAISYWLVGNTLRSWLLLVASVGWLALFSPQTAVVLTGLAVGLVWPVARLAARSREAGRTREARIVAWCGVIAMIVIASLLRLRGYFFTASDLPFDARLLSWIGFSYVVLKSIHVMHGVARDVVPLTSPAVVLQYLLFLPTLTSGPIYRLDHFSKQLATPKRPRGDEIQEAVLRGVRGVAKKVVAVPVLYDLFGQLHERGLVFQPAAYVVMYVLLFLDFSGYSDIAIAIGRLLGFDVPENFKHPFTATTLTQFWRNWHASLGDWLRENVFIPLGGMRARGARLSLIVVGSMVLVGIWHAFDPVFVLWGAYHGTLLVLENWIGLKPLRPHGTPLVRRLIRYALIQGLAAGGMFAFIHWTG